MVRAQKKLSFRFHEIATLNKSARNDKVFGLRPKRKLIQGVLINGMCLFEDGIGAATAATVSNAELNDLYERLRRVVGYCLAHKAWWHNKGTILFYASADFPSSSDVWLKRESTMFEK